MKQALLTLTLCATTLCFCQAQETVPNNPSTSKNLNGLSLNLFVDSLKSDRDLFILASRELKRALTRESLYVQKIALDSLLIQELEVKLEDCKEPSLSWRDAVVAGFAIGIWVIIEKLF